MTDEEPTPLRWGLNDVLWGDDDSVTVLLSGPACEPYWLELDPERAAVLRQDLAGPDGEEPTMTGTPASSKPTVAAGDRVLVTSETEPSDAWGDEDATEPFEAVLLAVTPGRTYAPYRVRDDEGNERDVFAVRATGLPWAQYETAQARHGVAAAWKLLDEAQADRNRLHRQIQDIVAFMHSATVSDEVRDGLRRIVERPA